MSSTTKDDYSATTSTKGRVGKTLAGSIETTGDVDWFKLDASKITGDRATFQFTAASGVTADLALYDSSGNLVTGGISNGIATLTTPGTYYVAASGAVGKYSFTVTTTKDDAGSTIATAAKGSSIKGSIESAGDVDLFKTALKSGKSYEFDLKQLTGDQATLSLLDSKGSVVATDSDHNGKITFDPTSNGDYYVSVAGASSNTGAYQVTSSSTTTSSSGSSGNGSSSGKATTYDLYANSNGSDSTYVVDASAGSFKFVLDMKPMTHSGAVVINNFGADDSLWISHGWATNLSMLRVADSGAIGQYQERIQVTQPFSSQNMSPESMNIWLGNLPGEVGSQVQTVGTTAISEFNALSVGDIHWS